MIYTYVYKILSPTCTLIHHERRDCASLPKLSLEHAYCLGVETHLNAWTMLHSYMPERQLGVSNSRCNRVGEGFVNANSMIA